MKAMTVAVVAFIVLGMTGCAARDKCSDEKCGAPDVPATTIRVSLAGQTFVSQLGELRSITVRSGVRLPITISISSLSGTLVRDVYLYVNSYPFTEGSGAPTGRVQILSHLAGPVASHPVNATWTAQSLFGTNQLDLSLSYVIGDFHPGGPIARINVAA